ncbi:ABC-2 type transport system ATP-binding protein [Halarchaeum rubridurum]|uniref:ABC transporter ATP-binding protein n=1 Tax=Halarchaeum rubridurum TaxID=489911 RepID=A0A830G3W0_9EURY|nr:ABC transporter ATP-binding protein [Halarchaeum rubridurum]MBP1955530.1 ABC-2 type transport system ATP-binding protein [Halarchaeum rubridurum]GGM73054.1 ABC transporter ATP-binding protein [Halarchaeum rubridurum]
MAPVVVAEDVHERYGDTVALDGVSLAVEAGEVFALIGPNGAGKTTLTRCLTGTRTPDGGRVELLGDPPADAAKERLGLLPQDFDPPDRLTARELVAYYAGLYDDARDPADLLRTVGMDPAVDTWYGDLSGGEQRRTCVAASLANDPDVLFVDEPTTGIDPAGRRALWDVFEDLADAGTTVFLTTHYMAEAERLADRVGLLADGALVATGTPADLIADYGGEQYLAVETDADAASLPDLGYEVTRAGDELRVVGVPPEAIGDVAAELDANGVPFDALSWTEPDLEDVYLRLAEDPSAAETDDVEVVA